MTLHGSGIHPGGITERFPLMVSSLSSAVTHVRAEEFSDIRTYNAPDVVRHIMGFGGTPEEAMQGPMAGLLEAGFKQSVRMVADHMGFASTRTSRRSRRSPWRPPTSTTTDSPSTREPWPRGGSAGGPSSTGSRSSPRAVNWLMGEENLDPAWNFGGRGERFEVEITGDPT